MTGSVEAPRGPVAFGVPGFEGPDGERRGTARGCGCRVGTGPGGDVGGYPCVVAAGSGPEPDVFVVRSRRDEPEGQYGGSGVGEAPPTACTGPVPGGPTVEPLPEWWRDAGGGAVDSGCAYAFPGSVDPERRAGEAPMVLSVEGGSYPAGRRTLCGVAPDGVVVELPAGTGVVQALQQAYCAMTGGDSRCRGGVVDVPLLVHLARGAAALGPGYVVSTLTDGAVRFTARGVSSTFWRERRADPLRVRFGCSDGEGRRVRLGPSAPPPADLMDLGVYGLSVWAWTQARLRGFRG